MKYGYESNVYIDTQKIESLVIIFDKKRESSVRLFQEIPLLLERMRNPSYILTNRTCRYSIQR